MKLTVIGAGDVKVVLAMCGAVILMRLKIM